MTKLPNDLDVKMDVKTERRRDSKKYEVYEAVECHDTLSPEGTHNLKERTVKKGKKEIENESIELILYRHDS